jgi:hypothetical protein
MLGALLSSAALGAPIVGAQRGELAPTPLDASADSTRPLRFAGIHASDVGAVACMGDSQMLGAFMNLKSFPDVLKAHHYALGASIGCGDGSADGQSEPFETLATLLRAASPGLRGASHGGLRTTRELATDYFWEHTPDLSFHCDEEKQEAQCGFNVAVTGAVFNDSTTPSLIEQVSPLAERLRRADPPIEGWTVVTLEAGVLDLLMHVAGNATHDPAPAWRASADRLLQRMRQELPGPTYVNVIAPLGSDRETGERVWALRRDALGGTPWMDVLGNNPVWRAVGGWVPGSIIVNIDSSRKIDGEVAALAASFTDMLGDLQRAHSDERSFVVRVQPLLARLESRPGFYDRVLGSHPLAPLSEATARALLQNMVSPPEAQVRDAATLVNRSWADLGLGEVGELLIR